VEFAFHLAAHLAYGVQNGRQGLGRAAFFFLGVGALAGGHDLPILGGQSQVAQHIPGLFFNADELAGKFGFAPHQGRIQAGFRTAAGKGAVGPAQHMRLPVLARITLIAR